MSKEVTKKYICKHHHDHCTSAIYWMGFVGAAIYYLSNATGFWNGVFGVLKSIVWPAMLVFEALKFLA